MKKQDQLFPYVAGIDKTKSKEFGCPLDKHLTRVLDEQNYWFTSLDIDVLYKANLILQMKKLGR